ncbi:hypothetical protein N8J89_41440 [Crossiella sp. CA-258035]|uniref:hypothetical protein n=1 Tax=Crossiella sp. CA-258035 TaxID=2981138 RepID=UPI0024BD0305|nr:hypothetical protein [Crossiella sp. CA-258035]WHT19474.1 hypothetical protein N8J89_41440 [Crossiella sp. CA-258035]
MHIWAKRGLKTVLVTGGLLALGTGVASAGENPDVPATPLAASVTLPIHLDNNAVGTALGEVDLPAEHIEDVKVDTREVVPSLPLAGAATKAGKSLKVPQLGGKSKTASKADDAPKLGEADPFRANEVHADAVVPVVIEGNAIAATGDADVENVSEYSYSKPELIVTNGDKGSIKGNVVDVDGVAPVLISGNAVAAGGHAEAQSVSMLEAQSGGDIETSGKDSSLSGNSVVVPLAVPVQLTGNAISGAAGVADTNNESAIAADAGGNVDTDGEGSSLGGNIAHGQVALPVEGNNNALGVFPVNNSNAVGSTTADAVAGGDSVTSGYDSGIGGNLITPNVAGPVTVAGNALAWGGLADSVSDSTSTAQTGGLLMTNGDESTGGGNIVDAAIAEPVQVLGNSGGWVSNTDAQHSQVTESVAGGDAFTNGDNSLIAGVIASAPLTLPAQVSALSGGWIANSDAVAATETTTDAGGLIGTRGNDSLVAGDGIQVPVAVPVEAEGNALGWIINSGAQSTSTTDSEAGGDNTAIDDDALGSGNAVSVPVAGPVTLNALAGGWIAVAKAWSENVHDIGAGGDVSGNGTDGGLSGNVVHGPVALPIQGQGISGGWIVVSESESENTVSSVAGGNSTSEGSYGLLTGNLITPAVAGPVQAEGVGAGWLVNSSGAAENATAAVAGGDKATAGDKGGLAGLIADVPVAVPTNVGGIGAGWMVLADGAENSAVASEAGGDNETSGVKGTGTGTVASVPVAAALEVAGDSVNWIGTTSGVADNSIGSEAGGYTVTDGVMSFLGGDIVAVPVSPVVGANGLSASLNGVSDAVSASAVGTKAGGDLGTAGDGGSVAGDIVNVPVGAAVQPFGDSVAALAVADSMAASSVDSVVGGTGETTGSEGGGLSGFNLFAPIGAVTQVYDIPVEVVGNAMADASEATDMEVGGAPAELQIPVTDKELGENLPGVTDVPFDFSGAEGRAAAPVSGPLGVSGGKFDVLSGLTGGELVPSVPTLPKVSVPTLPGVPALPGTERQAGLPGLNLLSAVPELPNLDVSGLPGTERQAGLPGLNLLPTVPGLPKVGVPGLPGVPTVPGVPAVPGTERQAGLPGLNLLPTVPGLPKVGVPGLPGVPTVPGVPAVPGTERQAGLPGLNLLPAVPALPKLGVPGLPGVPAVPSVPAVPGTERQAGLPGLNLLPALPKVSVPGAPTMPKLPIV